MKTFWIILVTVIVAGGLVGGGTYYYLNKKTTDDKKVLQTQIDTLNSRVTTLNTQLTAATTGSTATTGTTATTGSIATAGWKTYTNSTYGYSVKYPTNWSINSSNLKLVEFRETGKTYSIEGDDIYAIAISTDDKTETKTALTLANERKANMTVGTPVVTETTVNNVKAAQIIDYLQKGIIVVKNQRRYDIVTPNFGTEEQNNIIRNIYDLMITTFQFTS